MSVERETRQPSMIRRLAYVKDEKASKPRTVAIFDRMTRMAELLAQGMKPTALVNQVVSETGCSVSAAWRTWQTRESWLHKIIKVPEELGGSYEDIILDTKEARRLSMNLFHSAHEKPFAQVGALRTVGELAQREFKMRQTVGDIPIEPIRTETKTEVVIPEFGAEDLVRYFDTIVEVAITEEARELSSEDPEPDTEEPVD